MYALKFVGLCKKIRFLSTASMATSNDSLNHLPFGFILGTLFVLANLCIVFDIGTFSLFVQHPICFLQGTLNIMMFLVFLNPTSKSLVEYG